MEEQTEQQAEEQAQQEINEAVALAERTYLKLGCFELETQSSLSEVLPSVFKLIKNPEVKTLLGLQKKKKKDYV